MSKTVLNVHIDRIVLSGLDIDSGRTESLRSSIILELHKTLTDGGLADGLTGGPISHISVPMAKASKATDLKTEGQIARNVARSVSHTVRGLG